MGAIVGDRSGGGHTDQYALALGKDLLVTPETTRWSSDHVVIGEGQNDVFLGHAGVLLGISTDAAISLGMGGFEIGENTVILADDSNVIAQDTAMELGGDDNILDLNGQVQSDGTAILAEGQRNDISNTGIIQAGTGAEFGQDGILVNFGIIDAVTAAARATGDGHEIVNHGDITASGTAFELVAAILEPGATAEGALVRIVNKGDITAGTSIVTHDTSGPLRVINDGRLIAQTGPAIDIAGTSAIESAELTNTGTIIAEGDVAYDGSDQVDTIQNSGTIEGVVNLRGGDDLFDGTGGTAAGGIAGGAGDDTYIISDPGTQIIELEGEGTDEVIFVGEGGFSLEGMEFVELLTARTSGAINLVGHDGVNDICGGAGDDIISGLDGNDIIYGKAGNDRLSGDFGDDFLQGDSGDDIIFGGGDNDTIRGVDGRDEVYGGDGDDDVAGGLDDDHVDGGAGNDSLFGGTGDDTLVGGSGNDTIFGHSDDDLVMGGGGSDTIDGGDGDDTLQGGLSDDSLFGSAGNDLITGGAGNDLMRGQADNDLLRGSEGADEIHGDGGDDDLQGQAGDDTLFGGTGFDTLDGGLGNDTLNGNGGHDSLTGGAGLDTFVFDADEAGDNTVTDFTGGDTLQLRDFGYAKAADAAADFSVQDGAVVFDNGGVSITFLGEDPAALLQTVRGAVEVAASSSGSVFSPAGAISGLAAPSGDIDPAADFQTLPDEGDAFF